MHVWIGRISDAGQRQTEPKASSPASRRASRASAAAAEANTFFPSSALPPSLPAGLCASFRRHRFLPAHALAHRPPQVGHLAGATVSKRRVDCLPAHLAAHRPQRPPFPAQRSGLRMPPFGVTTAWRTRGPRVDPRERHPTPSSTRTDRTSRRVRRLPVLNPNSHHALHEHPGIPPLVQPS